jgi:hypothetical protein
MRSIASRLVLVALVSSLIMLWNAHNGRSVAAAQQRTPVALTRIYTGPDGRTHAQQVDLKLTPNPVIVGTERSETVKATSSYVVRFPPGYVSDWHPVAVRRYVITLSGEAEIELTGGQKIPLEPGRILQAEDLTGKGHITRTIGKLDWTALFIQFD